MKIERYFPIDALKPYVKIFMIIGSEEGMSNDILPDTSLTMAFRIAGKVSYEENNTRNELPLSMLSGLRKSSRLMSYTPQAAVLLAVFKEGGASVFFKTPLHELFGLHVSLDTFIRSDKLKETEAKLAEAKSNIQKIVVIEQFLLSRLQETQSDHLILNAIRKIQLAKGSIKIKNLAKDLYISQDPFEKRFRRFTGTSPKHFASVVRLRNVIATHSQTENITETALTAGYFDQAHFIKDFKAFTGKTPLKFFKESSYW